MQNDDSTTLLSRKRLKVNFFGSIGKYFYFNRPKPTIRVRLISERAEVEWFLFTFYEKLFVLLVQMSFLWIINRLL